MFVKNFNEKISKMENEITELKQSLEFSHGEVADLRQQLTAQVEKGNTAYEEDIGSIGKSV